MSTLTSFMDAESPCLLQVLPNGLAQGGDALYDLHIIHIESANGVTALIGFFEHFFCADQRDSVLLLLYP